MPERAWQHGSTDILREERNEAARDAQWEQQMEEREVLEHIEALLNPDSKPEGAMSFSDVVVECAGEMEFVKEFNRLTGHNLGRSLNRKPIEIMIDKACGAPAESPEDVKAFVAFVYEFVWCRLPEEAFESNPDGEELNHG